MANIRLTMRKIREVLRLHFECDRTHREIAQAIGTSTATVWQYLHRAKLAGLDWPLPAQLASDDAALEAKLYPPPAPRALPRGMPDWPTVHREISKPGVTLDLLWQEYRAQHPDGFGYSWFCKAYQEWAQRLPVTLRQTHAPGQKLFVDYSGKKLGIINPDTGEIREAGRSSRHWACPVTRLPNSRGRSSCPTGSARMCAPSHFMMACLRSWCPTT